LNALNKDPENLDLQYKFKYLNTRYQSMKRFEKKADDEARAKDPAAARAADEAKEAAAKEAAKKAELPQAEKLALLKEFTKATQAKDSAKAIKTLLTREDKKVKDAVAKVKTSARDKTLSAAQKIEIKALAEKAQKRYLALAEQAKMEEDKKKEAIEIAKEKAQALEDKRNAVKLPSKEALAIVKAVAALTKFVTTGDAKKDQAAKEAALEKAREFVKKEKTKRDSLKKDMVEAKEKSGDESKEYDAAKKKYYKQKAVYEQANKLIANTGKSTAKADASVDKARFDRALK
jgi:hypothetical protein